MARFRPKDYVVFYYEYQIGNLIFYPGTGAWVEKYRDNMVELKISGIGILVPENYLVLAKDYTKLTNKS